jgi:hypothetical protein
MRANPDFSPMKLKEAVRAGKIVAISKGYDTSTGPPHDYKM